MCIRDRYDNHIDCHTAPGRFHLSARMTMFSLSYHFSWHDISYDCHTELNLAWQSIHCHTECKWHDNVIDCHTTSYLASKSHVIPVCHTEICMVWQCFWLSYRSNCSMTLAQIVILIHVIVIALCSIVIPRFVILVHWFAYKYGHNLFISSCSLHCKAFKLC